MRIMKTEKNVPNAASTIGTTGLSAKTAVCVSTARRTTSARTAGSAPIARETDATDAAPAPTAAKSSAVNVIHNVSNARMIPNSALPAGAAANATEK